MSYSHLSNDEFFQQVLFQGPVTNPDIIKQTLFDGNNAAFKPAGLSPIPVPACTSEISEVERIKMPHFRVISQDPILKRKLAIAQKKVEDLKKQLSKQRIVIENLNMVNEQLRTELANAPDKALKSDIFKFVFCPECQQLYKNKNSYMKHRSIKHRKGATTKICSICQDAFALNNFSSHFSNCKKKYLNSTKIQKN